MTEPIRWGICSAGHIAAKFVTAITAVRDAEVTTVAARDERRAAEFAAAHGIPRSIGSYAQLAADPAVDVVYIGNTQNAHAGTVEMFLAAGKHVLCEKPLGLDIEEITSMFAAARANERFLMEAIWSRFHPSTVELGRLLSDGAIGAVRFIQADFSIRVPPERRASHRLFDPARGGGALYDLGIYPVQLAHLVKGAPSVVAATGHIGDTGVDEQIAVSLGWDDGSTAALSTSLVAAGPCSALVVGDEGSINLEAMFHATDHLSVRHGDRVETHHFDPASLHHQVHEVHRCLRAGLVESPVLPWHETHSIHTTLRDIRHQVGQSFGSDPPVS